MPEDVLAHIASAGRLQRERLGNGLHRGRREPGIRTKRGRPPRHDLPMVLAVAVLQLAGFFALVNLGLRYVPAGRSVSLVQL